MRAAVMRRGEIVVDEVPDLTPGEGQVLVETVACGICGSDLHALRHADELVHWSRVASGSIVFDTGADVVMGHEFSARVVENGPGVAGVEPGQLVVGMPGLIGPNGPVAIGYSNDYPGGYAEQMLLSSQGLLGVPDGLDPRIAALTEPMAVGLHAVNQSRIAQGQAAVVIGCGPVGLAVIAALAARGVGTIVAADFSERRRSVAVAMGATHVVDAAAESGLAAWKRIDGSDIPVIYECVGVPGVIHQIMTEAPRFAHVTVAGVCMEPDQIHPVLAINKHITLQFVLGWSPEEFRQSLEGLASGTLDGAAMITAEVGLDGVADAFRALDDPEQHVKILVRPELG